MGAHGFQQAWSLQTTGSFSVHLKIDAARNAAFSERRDDRVGCRGRDTVRIVVPHVQEVRFSDCRLEAKTELPRGSRDAPPVGFVYRDQDPAAHPSPDGGGAQSLSPDQDGDVVWTTQQL